LRQRLGQRRVLLDRHAMLGCERQDRRADIAAPLATTRGTGTADLSYCSATASGGLFMRRGP
jgi:hypothetical protein